ncbi:MAG: hypothetical protein A2X61_08100 [Ignavibacteria bacterium GWB2_35_12]|nr:MAG: hypothetical protein A2X61_08100 [Ignavibacteria bacterium GWB2_35_12]
MINVIVVILINFTFLRLIITHKSRGNVKLFIEGETDEGFGLWMLRQAQHDMPLRQAQHDSLHS